MLIGSQMRQVYITYSFGRVPRAHRNHREQKCAAMLRKRRPLWRRPPSRATSRSLLQRRATRAGRCRIHLYTPQPENFKHKSLSEANEMQASGTDSYLDDSPLDVLDGRN